MALESFLWEVVKETNKAKKKTNQIKQVARKKEREKEWIWSADVCVFLCCSLLLNCCLKMGSVDTIRNNRESGYWINLIIIIIR